jgi:hypothetical protein
MDERNSYHLNSEAYADGVTREQHVRKLRSFKVVKGISIVTTETAGSAHQGRM